VIINTQMRIRLFYNIFDYDINWNLFIYYLMYFNIFISQRRFNLMWNSVETTNIMNSSLTQASASKNKSIFSRRRVMQFTWCY